MEIDSDQKPTPPYELAMIVCSTLHLIDEFIEPKSCSYRKGQEYYREQITHLFRQKAEEWINRNKDIDDAEALLDLAKKSVGEYYRMVMSKKTF